MIRRSNDARDVRMDRNENRTPAFQLNKFQSEFNLSFNKEMAKVLAGALQNNEDVIQNSGKNIPTCLFALLSKLEDFQKPRNYDNYENDYDEYDDKSNNKLTEEPVAHRSCEYR